MAEAVARGEIQHDGCAAVAVALREAYARVGNVADHGVEIGPLTFESDRRALLRPPNAEYIEAELAWYHSTDRTTKTLERLYGTLPKVWQEIAGEDGLVNSQYGFRVWDTGRGRYPSQYERVVAHLHENPKSRKAVMMYAGRGTMAESELAGADDQVCTLYVQLLLRPRGGLLYHVNMRSNDAVFGYPNDAAWHHHLITRHLLHDLPPVFMREPPTMLWTTGALTVYPKFVHWLHKADQSERWDWEPRPCEYGCYGGVPIA